MEPRDCFDNVLFRKLLLALQSGADLRQRLGGRGLRHPGRKAGSSGAEGGSGNSGLAATRGARLARLLTTALPLASDDEQEKQDKLADLIQREQEIKDDCFNDEVEEPKFSASAWREGFESRGVTASMPPANEKLNQLKPDQEATEATEAEEKTQKTQKTRRPNAETASLANATGATDGSGATGLRSAQRTQRQKKKPPRGAMWFVPGETETASSRSKSKVIQEETVETIQEEATDTDQELTRASTDDPWQTLEDNRQLAWAFAQESESEPVDVWDQAPDANLKAMAWEELEKAEIELSKLKEEGLGLHQEEETLEPLTTEPPQELPIEALRTDILERVRQHRATILVGATGCGKSTRLPQYIMEEPGSKVLVTQPRRVAAVEIAKRVAAERGERVGKNVGYRISGEIVAGNGKLQFATIGYVLTWFLAKPEQFASFSHIIIDEVHERGADMELFLLLTKLLMYFFPRPKVILMSATMQPEEFSSYFSDFEVGDPLTVPGRTFPVQEVFLDNLLTDYEHILPTSVLSMAEEAVEEFDQLSKSQAEILQGLPELAVELVPYFAKKNTTLLIFLPGLVELNRLSDLFSSSEALSALPSSNREAPTNYKVFVLHSMVPRAEQEEVFKQPTGGCCHIVLASNIAESSLTLPQVAAVIDFGLHREPVFDPKQGLNCLSTTWCSHASVRQRGGRAGRTQPGIAIRLFTRHIYEEVMAEFDTPEILRTSFSRLFLRAKKLSEVLQKTAARFSAQCPLDLSSARSLLGSLPQPPNTALVKSAVAELANSGALTAPDEAAEITSLGIFMDGLPLDVSLCRLVWFGTLWGCTIEAVVMAAACSSKDPFNSPSRIFAESDEAYLAGLRLSWMARRRFDGGHFSEPIMMLRLFAYWAMHFGKLAQLKGKARFDTALGIVSKNANIHPGRFQSFLANIMDLAERARFLPLPGSPETVAKTMQDLGRLMSFFRCEHTGPSLLRTKSETKLRALLAAAFSEQLLVGRRFIDQLRGPPKRPRGAGAMASVLAGPRKAEEDEEEAQSYDHPTDETEPDDIFDLNAELATIEEDEDDLEDDDDEESQDLEDDDDVATGDDVQTRLPWKKARDEMIWAVNSLPEKGRKVHQRTVVAKLQTSQDTAGTVTLDRLPDVMAKLAGRAPQHVARKGKESEFAAVCFPRETVKELDLPSGPSFLTPPTLEGATPSASISHSFSMGSFFVDFDGDLVARPSSPYQLSFFLPERNTSSEEDKQQQIRGVLEARNPVGFPCHVNAGDDFFCTAASMQLLGSRTSVRVNGVTIFRAAEILFALATLCPERSFMSVRLGHGPAGGSRSSSPEHLLAVKILGWEISLLGDERGEGGAVVAEEALEAIQEVRASIKAAMARSNEDDTVEEDKEPKKRKLRPSRYEDTPEKVLDKLLAVVQEASERLSFSIDHQMRMHEAAERGRKRREKLKATKEEEVLLAGEESGFVDFLRPLEFCKDPAVAAARSLKRWAKKAPAAKFRCPVCEEVFVRARACRKHLKTTGHLCREAGQSWKSLVEERCLLEPAQLKQT